MDLFKVLRNIYCNSNNWFDDLEGNESSFMIHKWLGMNKAMIDIVAYMDKYVYVLTSTQYIIMVSALVPKKSSMPFVKWLKADGEEDKMQPIYDIARAKLKLSDNDWESSKKYYIDDINNNKVKWFGSLGIEKRLWKKHGIDFAENKKGEKRSGKKGLDKWF